MSDQTFTGSVIALNNYVLSVKVMHIADDEEEVLAAFRLLPSHDSSRFLEYLFNFCRSEHKNAASFSIYAGKVHVDHYLHVTLLEFRLGVAAPETHRQCPKGPARIDWKRGNVAGEIKSATDAAISGLLDAGTRGLLRDMAVAFPGQTLPSLTELQPTPLLSLSSKNVFLNATSAPRRLTVATIRKLLCLSQLEVTRTVTMMSTAPQRQSQQEVTRTETRMTQFQRILRGSCRCYGHTGSPCHGEHARRFG